MGEGVKGTPGVGPCLSSLQPEASRLQAAHRAQLHLTKHLSSGQVKASGRVKPLVSLSPRFYPSGSEEKWPCSQPMPHLHSEGPACCSRGPCPVTGVKGGGMDGQDRESEGRARADEGGACLSHSQCCAEGSCRHASPSFRLIKDEFYLVSGWMLAFSKETLLPRRRACLPPPALCQLWGEWPLWQSDAQSLLWLRRRTWRLED